VSLEMKERKREREKESEFGDEGDEEKKNI
jgi:hypothetical protein